MENHSSGKEIKNAMVDKHTSAQHNKDKIPADSSGILDLGGSVGNSKEKPIRESGKDQSKEWESPLIRGI